MSATKGPAAGLKCFQLTFKSLEGYSNLLGRKVEKQATEAEYVLRACMFSGSCFTGHIHETLPVGLVESLQKGAVICPIDQICYFYSESHTPSLLLVVELVAVVTMPEGDQVCKGLGWAMLAVFDYQRKTSVGGKGDRVRLPLYEGTPRALFSLQHPSTDTSHLVPVPGCILTITLTPHPILARGVHLFPEHVLVSFDDIIPGTTHTSVPEAYPKLVKSQSLLLEKVMLLLLPSVDDFEEQLLSALKHDLKTTHRISIEERRLKFIPYNGWNVISSPAISYLDKVSPHSSSVHHSSSHKHQAMLNHLVLRGSVELRDLIPHTLMEVILHLEYVIRWASGRQPGKPSQNHSTTLTVCWGVWQPFTSEEQLDRECSVTVELKGGMGFQLSAVPRSAQTTCYEGILTDAGKVVFRCAPAQRSSSHVDGSQLLTPVTSRSSYGLRRHPSAVTFTDDPNIPEPTAIEHTDSGVALDELKAIQTTPLHSLGRPSNMSTPLRKPTSTPVHSQDGAHPPLTAMHTPPPLVEVQAGQQPIIPLGKTRWMGTVSHSILAYLHSSEVPEFQDATGSVIPHVDPYVSQPPSFCSSLSFPLCAGLQFMAFETVASQPTTTTTTSSSSMVPSWSPQQLLLQYQFHCLSVTRMRCQLSMATQPQLPQVLHMTQEPVSPGNRLSCISHHDVLLTTGDGNAEAELLHYLKKGHLSIDVYDGDSLILLGTALLPLQLLMLQMSEENQYYQLSVVVPVVCLDSTIDSLTSDVLENYSEGRGCFTTGKLYIRLARLPPHQGKQQPIATSINRPVKPQQRSPKIARQIHPPGDIISKEEEEEEAARKRRQARMSRVRAQKELKGISEDEMSSSLLWSEGGPDTLEEKQKKAAIQSMLLQSISSSISLQPRLGEVIYFEHEFHNKHNSSTSVLLSWNDPNLRVVTGMAECQHLKKLFHQLSAVDGSHLLELGQPGENGEHNFLVHPQERVRIPFRYQCYTPLTSTGGGGRLLDQPQGSIETKVYFQDGRNRDLLAVLVVQVQPQQQRTDRVFHFYHPETTFLKKTIQLPLNEKFSTESGVLSSEDVFACCSDQNAMCEVREQGEFPHVYLKVPVKPAPCVQCLYVMIYSDRYHVVPKEIWQVFIHSVHKVDHCLTVGQSSPVTLTLRGGPVNRRVAYFTFSAAVLKVVTPSPQLLTAHSVSELQLSLKTSTVGSSQIIATAVDADQKQLLDAWLIQLSAQPPAVSRAFQVFLEADQEGSVKKTISYTNPYQKRKKFQLSTNHPELLQFEPSLLKLQPSQSAVVELVFAPCSSSSTVDILVFINNSQDQTEECFLVKTTYSNSS